MNLDNQARNVVVTFDLNPPPPAPQYPCHTLYLRQACVLSHQFAPGLVFDLPPGRVPCLSREWLQWLGFSLGSPTNETHPLGFKLSWGFLLEIKIQTRYLGWRDLCSVDCSPAYVIPLPVLDVGLPWALSCGTPISGLGTLNAALLLRTLPFTWVWAHVTSASMVVQVSLYGCCIFQHITNSAVVYSLHVYAKTYLHTKNSKKRDLPFFSL